MSDRGRGSGAKPSPWRKWLQGLSEPQDLEELREWLHGAERRHLFDAEVLGMIEGALQVENKQARDIMVPAAGMVSVRSDQLPSEFIDEVIESGHSRFPVLGDSRDQVVGILLAKDMLHHLAHPSDGHFDLRDVMHPVVFIPESMRLTTLLNEFRSRRHHMAVVVDEYSGVAGLVTIEDVIEEIVGEIDDEHDVDVDKDEYISADGNGQFTVQARTPIADFNRYFNTHYSDEEFDTIGGMVLHRWERLPKVGETMSMDNWCLTVIQADNRRLHTLMFSDSKQQ